MGLSCLFSHSWDGCKCKNCGKTRDTKDAHRWVKCRCTRCGKIQDTEDSHSWDGCKCTHCGRLRNCYHRWNGDTCRTCGRTRRPTPEDLKSAIDRGDVEGARSVMVATFAKVFVDSGVDAVMAEGFSEWVFEQPGTIDLGREMQKRGLKKLDEEKQTTLNRMRENFLQLAPEIESYGKFRYFTRDMIACHPELVSEAGVRSIVAAKQNGTESVDVELIQNNQRSLARLDRADVDYVVEAWVARGVLRSSGKQ